MPPGWSEPPLTNGCRRALIESAPESLQDRHVANRAVALDHDFEHDLTSDPPAPCVFRVLGLHFAQEARRIDTTSRSVRSSSGAAARAVTNSRPETFAVPRASARANAS